MIDLPNTPSFRLDGKRALVTGASSGIGLGCAVAVARAGAHTVLAARRQAELDEAVAALKAEGLSAEAQVMDVAEVEAVQGYVRSADPFDVLVNSAGLARNKPAVDVTLAEFDQVMNVNLRGAYFLTLEVAMRLKAAGRAGSMINISSQMGVVGGQERSVYCASKHAVEGFTKALAIEFGSHSIRFNTICPTFVRTPLTEPTFARPEMVDWVMSKIKLPRVGEIEDIAGAAVYLASDASALVTGTSHLVDGGWTAG